MERVLLLILQAIDSDALFRKKCEMGMFIQNRPAPPMTQDPSKFACQSNMHGFIIGGPSASEKEPHADRLT